MKKIIILTLFFYGFLTGTLSGQLLNDLQMNDLQNGLVAYYPFNGNANDESGNGHNGRVANATLTSDRFGTPNSAYLFSGSNDTITVLNDPALNFSGDFTITCWMKTNSTNNDMEIYRKHIDTHSWNGYRLFVNCTAPDYHHIEGHLNAYVASGSQQAPCSNNVVNNNSWVFVSSIFSSSANEIKLYINGILQNEIGSRSGIVSTDADFKIGYNFEGSIDDIHVYNRTLNDQEINALYHEGEVDLNSGLVAFYPFNGNASDESGNGHNATNNNAVLTKDRFGNENAAYSFSGQSRRIIIPSDSTLNFSNDFTIGFWMKTNATKNDLCVLHKAVYGIWTGYQFGVNWTNPGYCSIPGHLTSYVACNAFEDACSNNAVNTGKWVFVVSNYNNSLNQTKLYINGQLQDDIGRRTGPVANDSDLIIGYYFDGIIDDIRMYDRTLNENEIQALYNEDTYSITVGSDSAKVSSTIEIPVLTSQIQPTNNIISYQFDLAYDKTKLEFLECNMANTLAEGGTLNVNNGIVGKISVGYMNSNAMMGAGSIANLKFKVTGQGNLPLTILNFLYNADTITHITNGVVSATLYGDVDANSSVQAYDAALTLQHSVGMGGPWETWRIETADVDGVSGITAYDAALILQKSIGLIAQFPVENMEKSTLKSMKTNNADVDLKVENNNIVFYSKGSILGLNVEADNSRNILGTAVLLDTTMIMAFNNQNGKYAIGVATAYSPEENTAFLKIPFSINSRETFNMIINSERKSVTIDLPNGVVEFTIANVTIYPNPATDNLTVSGIIKPTFANIYSLDGQLLQTNILYDSISDLSISNLPSGVYIIKLQTDKEITVKRFVKQ
jgi:hypothetical protein